MKVKAYSCYKFIIQKENRLREVACGDLAHWSQFVQQVFEETAGFDLTDKGWKR